MQGYASKVTGMLIDLPVPEIQKYMVNFDLFLQRVSQATQLLEQQAIVAQSNQIEENKESNNPPNQEQSNGMATVVTANDKF